MSRLIPPSTIGRACSIHLIISCGSFGRVSSSCASPDDVKNFLNPDASLVMDHILLTFQDVSS